MVSGSGHGVPGSDNASISPVATMDRVREMGEVGGDAAARVELARRWLGDFPVHPHPDLGRAGPVCPYMGRARDLGRLELFGFDATAGDEVLVARARMLREDLERRSAASATDRTYLVYFLVPYGLPEPDLKAMVERVHARLRPEFVRRGLLAGDFWPDHHSRGLHSRSFRPFASPLPILGMRNMVPGDLAFFAGPDVPPPEQLTYLGFYRQHFAGNLPDYWRQRLDEAECAATAALAEH